MDSAKIEEILLRNYQFRIVINRDFKNAMFSIDSIRPVFLSDDDVFQKNTSNFFKNSEQELTKNCIVESAHLYSMLAYSRIWDRTGLRKNNGKDVLSIPHYIRFLERKDTISAFIQCRADGTKTPDNHIFFDTDSMRFDFSEEKYDKFIKKIHYLAYDCSEFSTLKGKLTKWRDQQAAHSLVQQFEKGTLNINKDSNENSNWGDVLYLFKPTYDIVKCIEEFHGVLDYDLSQLRKNGLEAAGQFWRAFG